ncbi:MAG: hypothetical protein QNI97_19690 [Desulfobacterales bacterium]|nr:hypothetical protein [Desulfobacterales bacterium]
MITDQPKQTSFPDSGIISRQLELVLASSDFKATPQQIALLKYVVGQTLAGNADRIKGYTVATEVFGRRPDFDQNIDPIVSIQAGRLRRALARYYQGTGKHDPLRIEIPKGSYVPVFRVRPQARATPSGTEKLKTTSPVRAGKYWPMVLVRSVRNVSGDPKLDAWGIGLAAELADELNRYPDIRVMTREPNDPQSAAGKSGPYFLIDGCVRSDSNIIKLIATLTDGRTGRQIGSSSCRSEVDDINFIALQERAARMIAVEMAGKQGWIAKTLSRQFQRGRPPGSEAYEAVLRYYEYISSMSPEAFQGALTALEKATTVDPECGQAWSMRARLFASIYAFEIPGFVQPLDQALAFAHKGLRLRPDDQRSHSIMAFVHLLGDEMAAGREEIEHALQIGPETLFMLDGIGYLLTLMGEWQRGPALIEKVIRANPFYSNYVHHALCFDWLRQKDYERAYLEAMKLNRPAHFWDHLTRAATLSLSGRTEDARRAAAELIELKPDFPENGRRLIGRLIKFDGIANQVIEGLEAVGVKVH